jgi:hypothetical protein
MTNIYHVELLWSLSHMRECESGVCFYFKNIINCLILHGVTYGKGYFRIV